MTITLLKCIVGACLPILIIIYYSKSCRKSTPALDAIFHFILRSRAQQSLARCIMAKDNDVKRRKKQLRPRAVCNREIFLRDNRNISRRRFRYFISRGYCGAAGMDNNVVLFAVVLFYDWNNRLKTQWSLMFFYHNSHLVLWTWDEVARRTFQRNIQVLVL